MDARWRGCDRDADGQRNAAPVPARNPRRLNCLPRQLRGPRARLVHCQPSHVERATLHCGKPFGRCRSAAAAILVCLSGRADARIQTHDREDSPHSGTCHETPGQHKAAKARKSHQRALRGPALQAGRWTSSAGVSQTHPGHLVSARFNGCCHEWAGSEKGIPPPSNIPLISDTERTTPRTRPPSRRMTSESAPPTPRPRREGSGRC